MFERVIRAVVGLLMLLFFVSCFTACSNDDATAVLWTNLPEMASYIELYNSEYPEYRIELIYREEPAEAVLRSVDKPDLVVGMGLNSKRLIDSFADLDPLLEENLIDAGDFYSDLFDRGVSKGILRVIPLSFNLPALMHKVSTRTRIDSHYVSLDAIREISSDFNSSDDDSFTHLGFSPLWESEFLYVLAVLYQDTFSESDQGALEWSSERIDEVVAGIREWIDTINGGIEPERQFTAKYVYEPGYKLLINDRVLFYYTTAMDYFHIPEGKRQGLDLRWIADEDQIPVLEDVQWVGIPEISAGNQAARAFLTWLASPDTQKGLLHNTQYKKLRTFGILDGFSVMPEINENILPQYYPALQGLIPEERDLIFPSSLPYFFSRMKTEIIEPWMSAAAGNREEGAEQFKAALRDWLNQQLQL